MQGKHEKRSTDDELTSNSSSLGVERKFEGLFGRQQEQQKQQKQVDEKTDIVNSLPACRSIGKEEEASDEMRRLVGWRIDFSLALCYVAKNGLVFSEKDEEIIAFCSKRHHLHRIQP